MDAPTPTQAPSRPSLLQLLRNLFELPRRIWGTREAGAEVQELGAVGDSSSPGELAAQCGEHWEGAGGYSTEPLLGAPGELSLSGSLGSSTSRSCLSLSTSDMELATAGDMGDTLASNPAWQSAGSEVASEEGTVMPEAFGDKVLETDGLLQGLGADGEDATGSGSPELMFPVDLDSELEAEQLLKADEGAGSLKTELSQWNRLFSMNRPRWTSLKPHALGSSMVLESEEEPLLNTTANKRAASVPLLLPLNPSDVERDLLRRDISSDHQMALSDFQPS